MEYPSGTIVLSTVGRPQYGFDIFSVKLSGLFRHDSPTKSDICTTEHCLTDGISINFNGQFVDDHQTLVYVSERTGAHRIYLNRPGQLDKPEQLPPAPHSLFHDRPTINSGRLYFISAHEPPQTFFKSWSALYSTGMRDDKIARLTPYGSVDYSPAVSQTGKFIAVASYGSRPWGGEFHDLQTDIVVFRKSDPTRRTVLCQHGGWPTWSRDSTIYFHRRDDDGWWSIFQIDLPEDFETSGIPHGPRRVTPPGLHSFTPAALHDGRRIAVATRRRGSNHRHIEIFDIKSQRFYPVTELINPNSHHYNPFVSPNSDFLGYHRFRGESAPGDSVIPHLEHVMSPVDGKGLSLLRMLRINGTFPTFCPSGDMIAFNQDFDSNPGLKIVKSDGSKRWTLLEGRTAFYNSWSPTEKNVIFTSIGPVFETVKAAVQIARISFDPADLTDDRESIPVDIKILTREDTGNNAFPSCSPDGKSLVFRSGRSGHKNLYIMDTDNGEFNNGEIRQLTKGAWIDTMPSWSPDGTLIAFSSNRHNPDDVAAFGIYVIRPDGTDLRRIDVLGSGLAEVANRERLNHVCFSADGEWLLFTANLGGVTAEPVSLPNQFHPYGDLYTIRLDGRGLRRLTWNGYENGTPAWHPWTGSDDADIGRLCLRGEVGDKLRGQFDEPLWIHCDF